MWKSHPWSWFLEFLNLSARKSLPVYWSSPTIIDRQVGLSPCAQMPRSRRSAATMCLQIVPEASTRAGILHTCPFWKWTAGCRCRERFGVRCPKITALVCEEEISVKTMPLYCLVTRILVWVPFLCEEKEITHLLVMEYIRYVWKKWAGLVEVQWYTQETFNLMWITGWFF